MITVKSKPHPLKQELDLNYFDPGKTLGQIAVELGFKTPYFMVNGQHKEDLEYYPIATDEILLNRIPETPVQVFQAFIFALSSYASYKQQSAAKEKAENFAALNAEFAKYSQAQSIRGGRNRYNRYGAIPVVLGKHLVVPFYGGETYHIRNGQDQIVYMLLLVGYGPLKITDIKIGDVLLHDGTSLSGNFEDIDVSIREGRPSDLPHAIYPYDIEEQIIDTIVPRAWQGYDYSGNYFIANPPSPVVPTDVANAHTMTTGTNCTAFRITLLFPEGIKRVFRNGSIKKFYSVINYQYKKTSDPTWSAVQDATVTGKYNRPWYKSIIVGNLDGDDSYDIRIWQGPLYGFDPDSADDPTPGSDRNWCQIVNLLTFKQDSAPINLDNIASIALRITQTPGQSGGFGDQLEQISCIAESYVTDWDTTETTTQNPALLYRHVMQGAFIEAPFADARLDLTGLETWGTTCDTRGYEFNQVLDYQSTIRQVLDNICNAGRARYTIIDNQHGAVLEDPNQTPVQVISPRNASNIQGARNYKNEIHGVKVRFINEDIGYQHDEWTVYYTGYNSGNATKFEKVEVVGITSYANAERFGRWYIGQRTLRRNIWTCEMDFENVIATKGDIVKLQYEVIETGEGGARILNIAGNDITVDELFTTTGGTDTVSIRLNTGAFISRTVSSISSNVLTLATAPTGAAVGNLLIFGDSSTIEIECIIDEINYKEDLGARISMFEAAPAIETFELGSLPSFDPPWTGDPEDRPPLPPKLVFSSITTYFFVENTGVGWDLLTYFWVAIQPITINYQLQRVEVQIRQDDSDDWETETIATGTAFVYKVGPIDRGETYQLRARGINKTGAGIWSDISTVTADEDPDSPVPDVTGLELEGQGNNTEFIGRNAKFTWRKSSIQEWEMLGYENVNSGAGNGSLDGYFKDYEVTILNDDLTTVRRIELVTDNFYIYDWEKNYEDARKLGESTANRSFAISVVQRSKQNQESTNPARLTVQNTAPVISSIETQPGYNFNVITYVQPTDIDWTGVRVYLSTSSGFALDDTNLVFDGPDTTIMLGDLVAQTVYYYQYVPYDAFGAGTASGELTFTTGALTSADLDDTPPTDPSGLILTTGVEDSGQYTKAFIKAEWTESTDAGIITGYYVEYWDDNDSTKRQIFTNILEWKLTDAVPGREYYVRVQAVDWAGNLSGWTLTGSIVADGDTTAPDNVTGLTLTAGLDKVIISYINPPDADFAVVKIHRGTSSGFTPSDGNLVTTFPGGVNELQEVIDSNVVNGVAYYYKTITVDRSGNESAASSAAGPVTPFKLDENNFENYFETAAITNAYIQNLDAAKITSGEISADRIGASTITAGKIQVDNLSSIKADLGSITSGTITGGTIRTAESGERVQLGSSGLEAYNTDGNRTAHINTDGSGYLGLTNPLQWTTDGTVTIPGTLISGEIVGNTFKTAASGWRIEMSAAGLNYTNGSTNTFQINADGSFSFGITNNQISFDGSNLTIDVNGIGSGSVVGSNSVAFGENATAGSDSTIAIGSTATSPSSGGIAIGAIAISEQSAIAIGNLARNYNPWGIAIGPSSSSYDFAVSIGASSVAGNYSTAVGYDAEAGGPSNPIATAFGYDAKVTGFAALGLGVNVRCEGDFAVSIGQAAQGYKRGAVAVGQTAQAYENCVAIGQGASAGTNALKQATAVGHFSTCNGENAFVLGHNSRANYTRSGAIGAGITASGVGQIHIGAGPDDVIILGDLDVRGGTKNFKIPHPTKENYWLKHAAYEGDVQGGNIYRRKVAIVGGSARIVLPEWFDALNKDIDIFVQADKHFGRAFGEYIEANIIQINADTDGNYKVLIFGTRQDGATDHFEVEEKMLDSEIFHRDYIEPREDDNVPLSAEEWEALMEQFKEDIGKEEIDDGSDRYQNKINKRKLS